MTLTDNLTGPGWAPAPGSVARHYWPLPLRWLWWLVHRPLLVGLVALAVLVAIKAGLLVLAVLIVAIGVGLVVWWRVWPGSFHGFAGPVLLGLWRSFGPTESGGGLP